MLGRSETVGSHSRGGGRKASPREAPMPRFITDSTLAERSEDPRPTHHRRNLTTGAAVVGVTAAAFALRYPAATLDAVTSIPGRMEDGTGRFLERTLGPKNYGQVREEGMVRAADGSKLADILFELSIASPYDRNGPIIRTEPKEGAEQVDIAKLRAKIAIARKGKSEEEIEMFNLDPTLSHLRGKKIWGGSYNSSDGGMESTAHGGTMGEWWRIEIGGEVGEVYTSNTYGAEDKFAPRFLDFSVQR